MKMQRIPSVILCVLLLLAASGCVRRRVFFDVPTSNGPAVEGYGKEGDTIQWRVFNHDDSFTVEFSSDPPCKSSDLSKLHATHDHPAECELHLVKGHPDRILRFTYMIVHDKKTKVGDGDGPFGQHVGSCGSCSEDFVKKGKVAAPVAPTATTSASTATTSAPTATTSTPTATTSTPPPPPTYFQEAISCEPSGVKVNPVNPSVGDTVQWYSPSGQTWQIKFPQTPPTACPSPMTQDTGKDTCVVAAGTSGQSYSYDVNVDPKHGHPGCTITAVILKVQ